MGHCKISARTLLLYQTGVKVLASLPNLKLPQRLSCDSNVIHASVS